jgi:hypothetical protein
MVSAKVRRMTLPQSLIEYDAQKFKKREASHRQRAIARAHTANA